MNTESVSALTVAKNLSYGPAAVLGILMHTYWILAIFLILDMVTGIWRSYVLYGGTSITSRKTINGFVSKFLFLLIPVVLAYMGVGIGLDLIFIAQSALGVLIFATGYSIIGNIYAASTGHTVKEFDAVRLILNWIQTYLEKLETPPNK